MEESVFLNVKKTYGSWKCLNIQSQFFFSSALEKRCKEQCGWCRRCPVMLTDSHHLHGEARLAAGRAEDDPPVQEVGRDQRRFTGSVCLDQHQVNCVAHGQHGGCIHHLTAVSCRTADRKKKKEINSWRIRMTCRKRRSEILPKIFKKCWDLSEFQNFTIFDFWNSSRKL